MLSFVMHVARAVRAGGTQPTPDAPVSPGADLAPVFHPPGTVRVVSPAEAAALEDQHAAGSAASGAPRDPATSPTLLEPTHATPVGA